MNYYLSYNAQGKVKRVHLDPKEATLQSSPRFVPEDWGMFTAAGNRSITKKAQVFVANLASGVKPMRAANTFFRSFRKLYQTKSMAEASDTAVREYVWSFMRKFQDLFPGGSDDLERLWNGENL